MATGTSSRPGVPAGVPTPTAAGPFGRWPRSSDAGLALVVFALEVVGILSRAARESGALSLSMLGDAPPATYLLLAASSIALLWRKNRPLIVLVVTLAASIVWDVLGLAGGPSLAIFVALYGVGRYISEVRTSVLAVAVALVLVVADDIIEGEPASVFGLSLFVVFLGWYLGRRIRARREYLALVEERADFLERERAAEARRAVEEERTRIARELHDVVAHRVSMITIQAGAAQTVAAADPEKAMQAMAAVEDEGRAALAELRQVLGALRAENEPESRVPSLGLSDIPDLVADIRRAGLDVSLTFEGVPDDVAAGVDLASYRIVQEALTNVIKHAGPDPHAEVRLAAVNHELNIEVTDDGVGVSTLPGSGQGLLGMRERTALLGGTFDAGPRPNGGFRIVARLPLQRSTS